ncbi:hypothetical protein DQQ10_07360 [Pseudochryseolinea flava]|uniref:Uncharacterized protein n=1 Tax=Pseudochryseolinea flava TaxID=2059302 RepID=A0A364Y676_9BACT|nr:hypothetical protein DQQ10_07360 [Pseudochryseolinea flava]
MRFLNHPHHLFLVIAIVILVSPLFFWMQALQVGMVVTMTGNIAMVSLSVLIMMLWIAYHLTQRFLFTQYLSWIHVLGTVLMVTYFLGTTNIYLKANAIKEVEKYLYPTILNNSPRLISFGSPLTILFILLQLLFVINIFAGLRIRCKSHAKTEI